MLLDFLTILREHWVFRLFQQTGLFRRPIARHAYPEAASVCAKMSFTVIMLPSMTLQRESERGGSATTIWTE